MWYPPDSLEDSTSWIIPDVLGMCLFLVTIVPFAVLIFITTYAPLKVLFAGEVTSLTASVLVESFWSSLPPLQHVLNSYLHALGSIALACIGTFFWNSDDIRQYHYLSPSLVWFVLHLLMLGPAYVFLSSVRFYILVCVLLMASVCYLRTAWTDPGRIVRQNENECGICVPEDWHDFPCSYYWDVGGLYCSNCDFWVPDRTKHCWQCDRCVLRHDHHCLIYGTCIGFFNQKYHDLCHFYAALYNWLGFCWLAEEGLQILYSRPLSSAHELGLCTAVLLAVNPFLNNAQLFLMHVYLNIYNNTTYEEIQYADYYESCGRFNSPYNHGFFQNLKDIYGPNFLLWLLPVDPVPGDGLAYITMQRPLDPTMEPAILSKSFAVAVDIVLDVFVIIAFFQAGLEGLGFMALTMVILSGFICWMWLYHNSFVGIRELPFCITQTLILFETIASVRLGRHSATLFWIIVCEACFEGSSQSVLSVYSVLLNKSDVPLVFFVSVISSVLNISKTVSSRLDASSDAGFNLFRRFVEIISRVFFLAFFAVWTRPLSLGLSCNHQIWIFVLLAFEYILMWVVACRRVQHAHIWAFYLLLCSPPKSMPTLYKRRHAQHLLRLMELLFMPVAALLVNSRSMLLDHMIENMTMLTIFLSSTMMHFLCVAWAACCTQPCPRADSFSPIQYETRATSDLHRLVATGDAILVMAMLQSGADLEVRADVYEPHAPVAIYMQSATSFHVAASVGSKKLVVALLAAAADINAIADFAMVNVPVATKSRGIRSAVFQLRNASPLVLACVGGHPQIVKILLQGGAKITDVEGCWFERTCTSGADDLSPVALLQDLQSDPDFAPDIFTLSDLIQKSIEEARNGCDELAKVFWSVCDVDPALFCPIGHAMKSCVRPALHVWKCACGHCGRSLTDKKKAKEAIGSSSTLGEVPEHNFSAGQHDQDEDEDEVEDADGLPVWECSECKLVYCTICSARGVETKLSTSLDNWRATLRKACAMELEVMESRLGVMEQVKFLISCSPRTLVLVDQLHSDAFLS